MTTPANQLAQVAAFDALLTDATAKQVLAYDETGAKLCGWKHP